MAYYEPTSGKDGVCDHGGLHDPAPPPDSGGDGGVAGGDDHSRDDEDGERHQAQVQLPLPVGLEVDPALGPVL